MLWPRRPTLILCRSAGNWLFRGRRWLDPADPDDRAAILSNYERLCTLFPPFGIACKLDKLIAALGTVTRRWAAVCRSSPTPHFLSMSSTLVVHPPAITVSATFGSSASLPRVLPTSAATVTSTALTGLPAFVQSAAADTAPTSCFALADIGDLDPRLPVATADDDYYESVCGMHAAAPDSPAWSSCRSDDSAGSDSDCDGGIDALHGPDAGTVANAGCSGGGPDDWLLLDVLADAAADGDGGGQGGALNAGQAVDTLLGEPGASTTPPPDGQPESFHGSWACGAWCMNDHYTIF